MTRLRDFEALEQVGDGDKVSYPARSRVTGASLVVHLFRGTGAPEGLRLLSLLPRFPLSERSQILDFGQDQGAVFFLTLELPGNIAFLDWIDSAFHPGRTAPVATAAVEAAPDPPQPIAVEPPVVRTPPPQPARGQGEFTQFYRRQSAPPLESATTTTSEAFDDFYRDAQPFRKPAPSVIPRAQAPLPRNAPDGPMDWLVHGEQGSPKTLRHGAFNAIANPNPGNEISPLFASDAVRLAPERVRTPDRNPHKGVSRNLVPTQSVQESWGRMLKPWLITMGAILGVALAVVLLWNFFGSA